MNTLPRCLSHAVIACLLISLCLFSPALAAKKGKSSRSAQTAKAKTAKSKKSEKTTKSRKSRRGRNSDDDENGSSARSRRGKKKIARNTKQSRRSNQRVIDVEAEDEQAVNQEREPRVNYPIVPDRIEVIEGGTDAAIRLFAPQTSRVSYTTTSNTPHISKRKIELSMDSARVTEIQQALIQKGYLIGEPTGTWDDLTYESMRKFQFEHKVDVTGYPTAHSLKLLGLTNW